MISAQEFIDELRLDLEADDAVKAQLVVASVAGQSADLQRALIQILSESDSKVAIETIGHMLDLPIGALAISRTEIAMAAMEKIVVHPRLLQIMSEDSQIQVVTVLGEMGEERGLKPLRQLLISEPKSANLRFTVYEALSKLPMRAGGYMLAAGLEDRDAAVRVAAARAIEKNLSDTLRQGVLNMLKAEDARGTQIVDAIVQGGAYGLIEALLPDDRFARRLAEHLEQSPDHEFMRRLKPLLDQQNRKALSRLIERSLAHEDTLSGPLIYAVDDSRTVLRMYRAALSGTTCRLKVFENPFEAIEFAEREAPHLVFTDLNMPEIDGLQLALTLRANKALPRFPIVMVSTQAEGEDSERASAAGINRYLQKPFKAATLLEAISELTDYAVKKTVEQ